jgi:ABC-2 type transport system ATP-binding protein
MRTQVSQNLVVHNVSYAFGSRQVLDSVSFAVQRGGATMLLGPNGAGKTTLFSLIAGLLAPQNGTVSLPEQGRAGLSIVFQQPALDLDLTVIQNLMYHGGLYGIGNVEAQTRLSPLLKQLDLESRRGEKVRSLNGGHRRRVEIIRALMTEPSLLLLDEPTAGLDAPTRQSLVAFLHDIAKSRNIAVFWATHLTDEASSDDDIVLLHDGRIKVSGRVADIVKLAKMKSLDDAFAKLTRREAA